MTATTLRNTDLASLAEMLAAEQAMKRDVIARADALRYDRGCLVVPGAGEPELAADGVTSGDLRLGMMPQAEAQIAERCGIPVKYARKCRADDERFDVADEPADWLLDRNVNRWLELDDGRMLVRAFVDERGDGVCRAVLSDRYRFVDHLDALHAAMAGVRDAAPNPGDVIVDGVDLTPRSMTVRFVAPAIGMLAPDLLRGYRSPFTGAEGAENPTVFAGFVLRNSETGGGAFTIVPRLVVQVCNNGMTMTKDAMREIHLGAKLDEGTIDWSDRTRQANVDLIASSAADSVRAFLSPEWMARKIATLTEQATVAVDPARAVERVVSGLRFSEPERETLLAHFIAGGQVTAGGVMQAVTSMAQTIADADRAFEVEAAALDALALAAAS